MGSREILEAEQKDLVTDSKGKGTVSSVSSQR